ncbi:MAG: hypothetical protein ABI867_07550 [Kofleriaceae bacterium]
MTFPIGETLANGAYRIVEHLRGTGFDALYLGEHQLVSVSIQDDMPIARLRDEPHQHVDGVFDVAYVGPLDVAGTDPLRDAECRAAHAFVEQLPEGEPILRAAPTVAQAVALGVQTGTILLRAVRAGVVLAGLRPDYIWVRRKPELAIAGIGGRNHAFFRAARPRSMVTHPLFTLFYCAPEVFGRGPVDDRALVFTLATLVAEWATGTYPFPDCSYGNHRSLDAGQHGILAVPAALESLLHAGLAAEPARRPSLDEFVSALAATALLGNDVVEERR